MRYDETAGRFELRVEPDAYELILQDFFGNTLPFKRANVYVRAGENAEIFLDTFEGAETICSDDLDFAALPSHAFDDRSPPIRYDIYSVDPPNTMVIKFCRKTVRRNKISYRRVFLTHKNLTIYSDRATLDTTSFTFRGFGNAKGRAMIGNGTCLKRGRRVAVDLRSKGLSNYSCRDLRFY